MCVGANNSKKPFPGKVLHRIPGNPGRTVLSMAEGPEFSRFRTVFTPEVLERVGF